MVPEGIEAHIDHFLALNDPDSNLIAEVASARQPRHRNFKTPPASRLLLRDPQRASICRTGQAAGARRYALRRSGKRPSDLSPPARFFGGRRAAGSDDCVAGPRSSYRQYGRLAWQDRHCPPTWHTPSPPSSPRGIRICVAFTRKSPPPTSSNSSSVQPRQRKAIDAPEK